MPDTSPSPKPLKANRMPVTPPPNVFAIEFPEKEPKTGLWQRLGRRGVRGERLPVSGGSEVSHDV